MSRTVLSTLLLIAISGPAAADNWPNWRGPSGNGVAPDGDFPVSWSATENIAWKVELPGLGASTPIVWKDRIFVTSSSEQLNHVIALNRHGEVLWNQAELGTAKAGKHRKASGSNPSPVTDGQHVFVYFKSGDLACLDFDGNVVWKQNLQEKYGEDTLWWDLGTSPVLTHDAVVVACMQTGPSYVAAIDKQTGKQKWKVDRQLGAPLEAAQSYTTPIVINRDGGERILVLGADHVTAHDAASGQEIWRVGGLNPSQEKFFRSISSPVLADQLLLAPYARGGTMTAIELGGKGDVTKSHVKWSTSGPAADVPTPVYHKGKAYVLTDRGEVAAVDVQTGKVEWTERLERGRTNFSSSPILAGGRLYLTREDGTTYVVTATGEPQTIAKNELDELTVATPVFTRGQILLRTAGHLYCIGQPGGSGS